MKLPKLEGFIITLTKYYSCLTDFAQNCSQISVKHTKKYTYNSPIILLNTTDLVLFFASTVVSLHHVQTYHIQCYSLTVCETVYANDLLYICIISYCSDFN